MVRQRQRRSIGRLSNSDRRTKKRGTWWALTLTEMKRVDKVRVITNVIPNNYKCCSLSFGISLKGCRVRYESAQSQSRSLGKVGSPSLSIKLLFLVLTVILLQLGNNLGVAYSAKASMIEDALACFQTAAKLNPLHEQAISNSVKVLKFLNRERRDRSGPLKHRQKSVSSYRSNLCDDECLYKLYKYKAPTLRPVGVRVAVQLL